MFKIFKKKKTAVHADKIPTHIAFICDGNRRWAEERGLAPMMGHRAGAGEDFFENMANWYFARGVTTLTFYVFSTENWKRSKDEVSGLMNLFCEICDKHYKEAGQKNIRFKHVGRTDRISKKLMSKILKLEKATADKTGGTIVLALDHGGEDEIIRAAQDAIRSGIPADELDSEMFETFMDTGELLPVDMVVRTSNENRTSGYLLWKAAYAELFFINEHWPTFISSEKLWQSVMDEYARRNRRFGGGIKKNYSG